MRVIGYVYLVACFIQGLSDLSFMHAQGNYKMCREPYFVHDYILYPGKVVGCSLGKGLKLN